MDTRLFFVVDCKEANNELYETLEVARKEKAKLPKKDKPRIRICLVKDAYRDGEGWNYDDELYTFTTIQVIN